MGLSSQRQFCKKIKREAIRLSFLNLFIHGAGIILADIVSNHQHFHSDGSGAHGDLQFVANLNILAGLYHAAVDADASVITGLVGYSPAFDQPGYFQIVVQSHNYFTMVSFMVLLALKTGALEAGISIASLV